MLKKAPPGFFVGLRHTRCVYQKDPEQAFLFGNSLPLFPPNDFSAVYNPCSTHRRPFQGGLLGLTVANRDRTLKG